MDLNRKDESSGPSPGNLASLQQFSQSVLGLASSTLQPLKHLSPVSVSSMVTFSSTNSLYHCPSVIRPTLMEDSLCTF